MAPMGPATTFQRSGRWSCFQRVLHVLSSCSRSGSAAHMTLLTAAQCCATMEVRGSLTKGPPNSKATSTLPVVTLPDSRAA